MTLLKGQNYSWTDRSSFQRGEKGKYTWQDLGSYYTAESYWISVYRLFSENQP